MTVSFVPNIRYEWDCMRARIKYSYTIYQSWANTATWGSAVVTQYRNKAGSISVSIIQAYAIIPQYRNAR